MANKLTLKGSTDKWCPASIASLVEHLSVVVQKNNHFTEDQVSSLKKNIAYNLQSIEFLNRIPQDLNLTTALITQNIKLFVVCGTSIIEALFYYLVISNSYRTKVWKPHLKKIKSQPYQDGENTFMFETEIFIKVPPLTDMKITFNQMCQTLEENKLLGDVGDLYKEMSFIRKLRNKVHVYDIKHSRDTDWWTFNEKEFKLMKKTLYIILTSSLFSNSSQNHLFDYLK
jgi:hypothetical protein